MNGFAALDTAAGRCSRTNKRSVAAPSPEFRCATSFYQRQICEKLLTVPGTAKYQLSVQRIFVSWLLCRHYRRQQVIHRGVHPKPRKGRCDFSSPNPTVWFRFFFRYGRERWVDRPVSVTSAKSDAPLLRRYSIRTLYHRLYKYAYHSLT